MKGKYSAAAELNQGCRGLEKNLGAGRWGNLTAAQKQNILQNYDKHKITNYYKIMVETR